MGAKEGPSLRPPASRDKPAGRAILLRKMNEAQYAPDAPIDPRTITRPVPALLAYYLISSVFTGPALPVVAVVLYFKYRTLKYRFDDDGISMSWGILFRREIYLTYRRIQDIHLTRNIVQRWLGLASIEVQTASGSSKAEMKIEGIRQYESLRDFLYERMRGARGETIAGHDEAAPDGADVDSEALVLLREIRDAVRQRGQPSPSQHVGFDQASVEATPDPLEGA